MYVHTYIYLYICIDLHLFQLEYRLWFIKTLLLSKITGFKNFRSDMDVDERGQSYTLIL